MIIDYILLTVAFIWIIFASISDIKTREVPNWLSFSLIIIAFSLRAFQSLIYKNLFYFLFGVIGFIIFFIIASLMYYTKQWGGGDAKLLMGLGIIFATYPLSLLDYFNPKFGAPFLIILFINILLAGAIYGLIWSIILAMMNRKKFSGSYKEVLNKKENIIIKRVSWISFIFIMLISFLVDERLFKLFLILFGLTILFLYYLYTFVKVTEKTSMFKLINVNKLTEGDWIIKDIFVRGKKIYSAKKICVEKKDIDMFKKYKVKKVLVKEGIPFIPSFLIGVIISLIWGNILLFILI